MRLVIDLQGAQSSGSRNRGIGRYATALARSLVLNRGKHEILIVLNGLFEETIDPIRAEFADILPQANILVWEPPARVGHVNRANDWRRKTAEIVREAFLASLKPDFILIMSLFEGLDDDVVSSIGVLDAAIPTAVVLYDLIPLIHRKSYLENPVIEAWFENKLDHLRRATLLLSISESSRREGIEHLGFPEKEVVNISTAADPQFVPRHVSVEREAVLRQRYSLERPFVMCTGGIDFRKNNEGLIRAYADMPNSIRSKYQLAIVCAIKPASRTTLQKLAYKHGLERDELILTGFVPEEDLLDLYNLCELFVFPSWHEGFGLPALEAMSCGRAVIAAQTSSLPEVIGREDALFDPHSDKAITNKIVQVLTDRQMRTALEKHGLVQAKKFTWDSTGKTALAALEARLQAQAASVPLPHQSRRRLKLAYLSPLPPMQSGISDYSAELLPELAKHYDIDVIVSQDNVNDAWISANCLVRDVDWFKSNYSKFDRVLYHFGNNHLHQHLFDLLETISGVVVLHDFFLSGIVRHMDLTGYMPGKWDQSLYDDHGYIALQVRYNKDDISAIWDYPNNTSILNQAKGVIVHSASSQRLASQWYGADAAQKLDVIPLLRAPPKGLNREEARQELNIGKDDFVVCSFGFLSPTKLNQRLLDAWLVSTLAKDKNCHLIYVGENSGESYGVELVHSIERAKSNSKILITGWVDTQTFRNYLAVANVGVQLRSLSRGETSAAVLDCMNYGIPTITNAHGSLADLPKDAVWMLPDEFSDPDLVAALETLRNQNATRDRLGQRAAEIIATDHNPRACAERYHQSIEALYESGTTDTSIVVKRLAAVEPMPTDAESWALLASSLSRTIRPAFGIPQLLIDVSALMRTTVDGRPSAPHLTALRELLLSPIQGFRTEPIYVSDEGRSYYARKFSLNFLGCPDHVLRDEPAEPRAGDIYVNLFAEAEISIAKTSYLHQLRKFGIRAYFLLDAIRLPKQGDSRCWASGWLRTAVNLDSIICASSQCQKQLITILPTLCVDRSRPLSIWSLDPDNSDTRKGAGHRPDAFRKNLAAVICGDRACENWMPDGGYRIYASDVSLKSSIGRVDGLMLTTSMQKGCLLHGPYLPLRKGTYNVCIYGKRESKPVSEIRYDIAANQGSEIVMEGAFDEVPRDSVLAQGQFTLDRNLEAFELRIWVDALAEVTIFGVQVLPVDADNPISQERMPEWLAPVFSPRDLKIGWMSTWNTRCGIASYSEHLIKGMKEDVTVYAAFQENLNGADDENCIRIWNTGKELNRLDALSKRLSDDAIDAVVVQFNYGFFDFHEFSIFLRQQVRARRVVIVMMHSTVDPYGTTPNWNLSEIRDALGDCNALLVHSEADVLRLRSMGLSDNVHRFPHGVVDYVNLGKSAAAKNNDSAPLIAAYGFCLPHKGLRELVEAFGIMLRGGHKLRLRLVNAEYPVSVSHDLISELKALVRQLDIQDSVEFYNDYLTDETSLDLLASADLIVFPYQETGESSSAAARYGLASGRPVAVTPLRIFDDLGPAVHRLGGTSATNLATGILDLLTDLAADSSRASEVRQAAATWRSAHSYNLVSERLSTLCAELWRQIQGNRQAK